MDFIVRLQESNGYNTMPVVVDRLSKMAHYISTTEKITSEQVVRLFFNKVFKHHKIPDSIISNYGTQFTSKFSKALYSLIGINQGLSVLTPRLIVKPKKLIQYWNNTYEDISTINKITALNYLPCRNSHTTTLS